MRTMLSFLIISLLMPAAISFAVIPPLDDETRIEMSSNIVTGYITSIRSKNVQEGRMPETVYTVQMIPFETIKGDMMSAFTFNLRRIHLPNGMCGHIGQNLIPKMHTVITAYMYKDENGKLNLLEPNGWELSNDIDDENI